MRATRRGFIGGAVGAVAAATAAGADKEGKAMVRPKVLFFDVNETLLDLKPLKESVGKALGGSPGVGAPLVHHDAPVFAGDHGGRPLSGLW